MCRSSGRVVIFEIIRKISEGVTPNMVSTVVMGCFVKVLNINVPSVVKYFSVLCSLPDMVAGGSEVQGIL